MTLISIFNRLYSFYIRSFVLRNRCGANCYFHFPVYIYSPENLVIGDNVKIGPFCTLFCQGGITLGDNILVAANTVISSAGHELCVDRRSKNTLRPVRISSNVWIGAASVILQGVNVGVGTVIGAGTLVTKSIPDNVLYTNKRVDHFRSIS